MLEQFLRVQRKAAKTEDIMDLLCDFIFPGQSRTRMFYRAMTRELDPLLETTETIDNELFLDYLPLLRCMAVRERACELLFQAAYAEDPDSAASMMNRKRATRRGKKLGREHYFERKAPTSVWNESDKSAKEVGGLLAEQALLYER
jgi:hypothetical protein